MISRSASCAAARRFFSGIILVDAGAAAPMPASGQRQFRLPAMALAVNGAMISRASDIAHIDMLSRRRGSRRPLSGRRAHS